LATREASIPVPKRGYSKMGLRKQTKETYEEEAKIYDKTRTIFEKGRFAYRERKLLFEFLERKSLVLFIACGTGRHFKFVLNQLGSEVVGIDISVNMIKFAKKKVSNIARTKQNVHLIVADVENLPFRGNMFDAVVCSRAFYLFDDKFRVLQEAHDVLKKGKKLMISTIFMDLLLTRLGIRIGALSRDPQQYPYTSRQLAEMFGKAHFKNMQRRCIVSFTGDASHIPSLILRIIQTIEDRLHGGRWAMVIGEKAE